ncbi:replication-associated protein [Pacific flying fox faeces associated circular DNA virus-5]|nr:replication-associated protein [Pacific flying fox faeces associated circular DNA virus-5]
MGSRRYVFTIFVSSDRDWITEGIERQNVKYLVAQQEICSETGRLHWQGYAEFKKVCRIPGAKSILGCDWAHLAVPNGDRKANKDYCTKLASRAPGGESIEIGKFEEGGQGRKSTSVAELREEIRGGQTTLRQEIVEGRVLNIGAIRYFERLQSELDSGYQRGHQIAAYLFGTPGTGKSHIAHAAVEERTWYSKDATTKWWDGYSGEEVVIVDDWSGPSTQAEADQWKKWVDRYPCRVETKGGHVWLKTKQWIFTSNVRWVALPVFFDAALKRRFIGNG